MQCHFHCCSIGFFFVVMKIIFYADVWDGTESFWNKLKLAATEKMGPTEAERFCRAFQQVYNKLVYEELTLDAARKFINSSGFSGK
ncbi:Hypothetical predicted protein [Olea europaea subsp. europaea]|uniref:Uncharacterized protein n=1 Tax=Olea europaea subsp. europaea TaxID=158383 RepID=A0A8S0S4S4_OLEEU|nr:Hypothetical predicted protein [Olea europaea subsp. europaea]